MKISRFFAVFMVLMLLLGMVPSIQTVQAATPTELFFSEYIEGSSNNKALEIYNGTGAPVNLLSGGYNVQMYFNGSTSAGLTINLTGTVANGDVYVVAHSSANASVLAQADQTNGSGWFNGNDAVVLRKGTIIIDTIDAIGQIGFNPGTEWGTGLTSTADNTLRRINTICAGDPNGSDAFDPSLEWEGFATDTFGGLGSHTVNCPIGDSAPEVSNTYPANGATDFPINANLSVTFSEPVNVIDPWFTLTCSSVAVPAAFSGGPTSFAINPSVNLTNGESCTLTILASQVKDQDGNDPPDNMLFNFVVGFSPFDVCAQPFTPIYDIQGSGATAAITGGVTTQGVVVGDYEGPSPTLRGFFLQDAPGDGNLATSDGIFVFNGNNNSVNVGDVVRITGTVSEFQGQTQVSASTIANCGAGSVAPVDVTLPFSAVDFPEQYEGMLVRLPQTLYVTEHFQLGRFGQVVVSSGARLQQPTNVVEPGAPAEDLQSANNLNRIIIDDALNNQNPDPILFGRGGQTLSASNTLRGGDTATGIVGVMTYTWAGNSASGNAYRVRPINALEGYINFDAANERPVSAPDVGGTLRVAGMNLLNFFNTFDGASSNPPYACTLGVGGALTDCRGADDQAEFDRQWVKTVTAILKTNADIVGLIELENDGYGPDSAIQFLVNELNAATAAPGTYTFIDVDSSTGQVNALGTDAIKVGLIYKPASVTPIGQTAALNTVEFVNGGDGEARNRPALAQAFETHTGGRFVVSVNHLKSKGSACDIPDAGDGQGNCNIVRVNAANALTAWLASNPTGIGDPDALIIGDLNSYAMEDPITAIKGAGYTNLIFDFLGSDAYSYVFDGQWGYLDHALGSASLATQVIGVGDYHINSDEPSVLDYNDDFKSASQLIDLYAPDEFRIADHDPVIIGLDLVNYPPELGDITVQPALVAIGATVNARVPFTDPDKLDTHTAAWDWGDGTTSAGTVSEASGSGTITGDHVYTTPGLYTVQVTVYDNYNNSDSAVFEYVVVYDPNGGFVTGGGWIDSPAGAYLLDPALSGKATFGFVAKYKKGASVPEGNTEFQFKAGDLNFKSTSYEWLVVAGSKAQFKGVGTINGADVYKFMLTAVDGSPDTFRIKIWYTDVSGDVIIYDNGPNQPIASGSIIVHKAK